MRGLKKEFKRFPLGTIEPQGWLKNQMLIQAAGLTGNLEEVWEDVKNNGWKGGEGESWERGPYYLDGLIPLAYGLKDKTLIDKGQVWIEWTLRSQKEDGSFGPRGIKTVNTDVNKKHDWWHYMIMLKVLSQYKEATGDKRVVPFFEKFFEFLKKNIHINPLEGWAAARGCDLILMIYWLYEINGDESLLELVEIIEKQSVEWTEIFTDFPYWRKVEEWDWRTHVVNVAMGIKMPGVLFESNGKEGYRAAVYKGIESLMRYHGQANGMFSGDEWLSGTHPSQGVELCAVVEYMYSLENLIEILGDGYFGDVLEKITFNALPGGISEDWTSHQYDQQVNQIICSYGDRPWSNPADANLFGLEPCFGCCTANMHQGWPKYLSSLWMEDHEGGLCAVSYAPCSFRRKIEKDIDMSVNVITEYPFRDRVQIQMELSEERKFKMHFRIPKWCKEPKLIINGKETNIKVENGYSIIDMKWVCKNNIVLEFPSCIEVNKRSNSSGSITKGPLVFVIPVKEQWIKYKERGRFSDWEIYPQSQWKYGISEGSTFTVIEDSLGEQPFSKDAPLKIAAKGRVIMNWKIEDNSAGSPPLVPKVSEDEESITLVPYACTKLRVGEFPVLK